MSYEPFISVIIPTFNRKDLVSKTILSINQVEYPRDKFEVIIIDDGSNDQTETLVSSLPLNYILIYHYQQNGGVTKARNKGIELSKGEIISFISDDVTVDSKWLSFGVDKFQHEQVGGVEGAVILTEPEKVTPFTHQTEAVKPRRFIGANIFYRKKALSEVGGYDERFKYHIREDSDIAFSILNKNWIIDHAFDSKVYHPTYKSKYWGLFKEAKDGFSEALLYSKHKNVMDNYQLFNLERKTLTAIPHYYYGFVLSPFFLLASIIYFDFIFIFFTLFLTSYGLNIYAKTRRKKIILKEIFILLFTTLIIPFCRIYYLIKGMVVFKSRIFL